MLGSVASRCNSAARYSCIDRPERAARWASAARVLSGTWRIVIDTGMHAYYLHLEEAGTRPRHGRVTTGG